MNDSIDVDGERVSRAKAGDFSAFESLVTQYERPIYSQVRRIKLDQLSGSCAPRGRGV